MAEIAPGIKGYLVRPAAEGTYPCVLVIHENRGLNPHIKDVTRRMAKEGFIAFGADYLTPMGGTPEDADKARDMIGELKKPDVVAFSQAAVAALAKHLRRKRQGGGHRFLLGRRPGECAGGDGRCQCSRLGWPITAASRRLRMWRRSPHR